MKRTPLQRKSPMRRSPLASSLKRGKSFAASPAQRAKVKDRDSITGAPGPCDPAHVVSRSLGGCDDERCVVALTREEHRAYDSGELDIYPLLVGSHVEELQHALGHMNGSASRLLHVLTGVQWGPMR
jgi:hypothetical protein